MANSGRDSNGVTTEIGVLNTDGATPTPVKGNPTTHEVGISIGTSGSDLGDNNADRDDNGVTGLCALSSDGDGAIVPLYINSSGQIMVKQT